MSNLPIEFEATILPTTQIEHISIKEESSKQLFQKPAYQDTILHTEDFNETQAETQSKTQAETQAEPQDFARSLNRASILGTKAKSFASTPHRYVTESKLGEGNFGIVWKAVDSDIGREIAIKTFKVDPIKGRQMFEDEIKVAGYLDHPGIPPIHDVGIDENGKYYFVMKYIHGEPLSNIIEKLKEGDQETHDRFPFERRADLIIQLLRILKAAHQVRIVHRDIKPDNIMIGPADEVMLVDWGIAINLNETNGEKVLCGTPLYMSPEQAEMKALTRQSDLYSVGAVFYELLSLSRPIPPAGSVIEMLQKVIDHTPAQVDLITHPTQGYPPSEYRAVVERAMHKNPQKRFVSAEQMIRALTNSNVGCVDGICPRTKIRKNFYQLMKWIDFDPFRNLKILMWSFVGSIILLISLGVMIGRYCF
jgi:serine/threonine-protein kinase